MPPLHPTCATVDVPAFLQNLHTVRALVGPRVRMMAVVKADAYGHGMIPMAEAAVAAGVDALAVARVTEGFQLRQAGIGTPLLVFEVAPPELLEAALAAGLELTIASLRSAEEISAAAGRSGVGARVHVKVDTGMGRLGFPCESAAQEIVRSLLLSGLELAGVYSHFATADDIDQSFALLQIERFTRVLEELHALHVEVPLRHMAGSGGILAYPAAHFDMVRPGIMLYGYAPRRGMATPVALEPVLSLETRVSFTKSVPAGTPISYGCRYRTDRETVIATIPVGYGDGYSRLLTNRGEVLIRGRRYRIAGTVCMDHCMVDVGPEGAVEVGDRAVLLGRDGEQSVTAWDLAGAMGTIPYEVTCLITSRIPRTYRR